MEPPKTKSILRKGTQFLRPKRTVQFATGTLRPVKFLERKGPSQGVIQRCEPHERSPYAPTFEDRIEEETFATRAMRRQRCVGNGKNIHKLIEKAKATFFSHSDFWCQPAPSSTEPEERICCRFQSLNAHAKQERSGLS